MASVTPTQEQINAILNALASGALEVAHGSKRVRYDSTDQMIKRLNYLIGCQQAANRPRVGVAQFSRGPRQCR